MRSYQAASLILALLAFVGVVWANSNGTNFEALTGAPGESTCADCHNNLNTGSGSVSITAPADYNPGDTLDITVAVAHTGQSHWGFELTVLDDSDQPVGELLVTDAARTLKSVAGTGREYVKQTSDGSDAGKGNSTDWSFQWVAPPADAGAVTFYTASVAANQASGPNGDFTYTTTHVMLVTDIRREETGSLPNGFHVAQNYPNPFNPATTIAFSLPVRSHVSVAVYNVLGQQVRVLGDGVLPAGNYTSRWDGTSEDGRQVASGIYFYRVHAGDRTEVRTMVLLK
ncbi:MAG: T9SS type A sorting domain-containing protein [Candidatus Zixiibacteriota bacterium]|nr:MAG: T9SS type A sorting domain-containing protein [candidate division Zixibacteria bacterium]